jgi:hypothetical protein
VWVQFDDNRFRRAQELTAQRTDATRTWQIDFRPQQWAVQTVQVSANREYVFAGATTQSYTLTLGAPFVAPVVPAIQSVTPSARTVAPGASVTFTIRTNLDVNYVWAVDVDGTRRNATAGAGNASGRNWTVTFVPPRTGTVNIFANATNENAGAATRTEQITVGQNNALILNPTTARWTDTWSGSWRGVVVEVTTNQFAEQVWVRLPNGTTHSLSRVTGSGVNNRTWRVEISDVGNATSLEVHVSDASGSWTARDTRHVNITGHQWHAARVDMQSGSWVSHVQINSNGTITFHTSQSVSTAGGIQVDFSGHASVWATSHNGTTWTASLPSNFSSDWHNISVIFFDNTATGRGTAWGTLRWN